MTMKELTIIISYRNRDIGRVKRCLDSLSRQSFKDFDVFFIDYGSDIFYTTQLRPIVDSYRFVNYHHLSTGGYPWNKSHALNFGIRLSSSNYILIGDIDLIYSPDAISGLMEKAAPKRIVFGSMFYLGRSFSAWDRLFSFPLSKFKDSGDEPIGAIYLVHRSDLESINGFDEYYCFWGVEDRDVDCRMRLIGAIPIQLDKYRYPIFHQWHPFVSDRKRGFFPEKWWDTINIYFSLNRDRPIRNENGWGKHIRPEDRPIFTAEVAETLIYSSYGSSYQKAQEIDRIVKKLNALNGNECLQIILRKRTMGVFSFSLVRYVNLLIRICRLRLGIDYIENTEKEKYFYPADIFYVVWQLIRTQGVIRDYSMIEENGGITIRLMRGISLSQQLISQ